MPFLRKRFDEAKYPPAVSDDDFSRAHEYLRANAGVDIEQFLDEQSLAALLLQPLGPTEDCLCTNDIATFVEQEDISIAKQLHLTECNDCRREVELYQAMRNADLETAGASGVWIVSKDSIRIPENGEFFLLVANTGTKPLLSTIDPGSVTVAGPIEATGCRLRILNPTPYDAQEAVALSFPDYDLKLPRGIDRTCDFLTLHATAGAAPIWKRSLVCVRQGSDD